MVKALPHPFCGCLGPAAAKRASACINSSSSWKRDYTASEPTTYGVNRLDVEMLRPLFGRSSSWDSLHDWPKSKILERCRKASFWLEADDCNWMETVQKSVETCSWPGFQPFPLVNPVSPASSRGDHQTSKVSFDGKTWRICLEVGLFSSEEIGVKINQGFLEVSGKHEEKLHDHEIISRCFTRKYKLPAEVDLQRINSSLYPGGVLVVEVPWGLTFTGGPTEMVIPTQIKENAFDLSYD